MGSAHCEVVHRMLESLGNRIGWRPSKLALHPQCPSVSSGQNACGAGRGDDCPPSLMPLPSCGQQAGVLPCGWQVADAMLFRIATVTQQASGCWWPGAAACWADAGQGSAACMRQPVWEPAGVLCSLRAPGSCPSQAAPGMRLGMRGQPDLDLGLLGHHQGAEGEGLGRDGGEEGARHAGGHHGAACRHAVRGGARGGGDDETVRLAQTQAVGQGVRVARRSLSSTDARLCTPPSEGSVTVHTQCAQRGARKLPLLCA